MLPGAYLEHVPPLLIRHETVVHQIVRPVGLAVSHIHGHVELRCPTAGAARGEFEGFAQLSIRPGSGGYTRHLKAIG